MTSTSDTKKTSPRRGRPGYDRETLLSICVKVFNERGYEATSMEALSEALGISKSAIYHHVNSKEEILEQALDRALDSLELVLEETLNSEGDGGEHLERAIRGTVDALIKQLPSVTLLLRLRGNSEVEERALVRRRELTRTFAQIVEQAQASGAVRSEIDNRAGARLILGMINSLVDWYRPNGGYSVEDVQNSIVNMTFNGLKA
ncbi:TetR/AcrR family transcriptional regulator [Neomicrococcus lactis]